MAGWRSGSMAGWRAGQRGRSRAGSRDGSRAGSKGGPRAWSRGGSMGGSGVGLRGGSRTGSKRWIRVTTLDADNAGADMTTATVRDIASELQLKCATILDSKVFSSVAPCRTDGVAGVPHAAAYVRVGAAASLVSPGNQSDRRRHGAGAHGRTASGVWPWGQGVGWVRVRVV